MHAPAPATAVRLFLGGLTAIFVKEIDAAAKETVTIEPPYKSMAPIQSAPIVYQSREVFAGDQHAMVFVFRCSQAEANRLFALWLQSPHVELSEW